MSFRLLTGLLLLTGLSSSCLAQGRFSSGVRFGVGGSVIPMDALVEANGSTYPVYAGTTFSTGLLITYVIGERLGFESGLLVTHYSYFRDHHSFGRRLLKGAAEMELADFQVPLVLLHRLRLPKNPHTDFTFSVGTSLDWLATDLLIKPSSPAWLKNVIAGIRFGKEKMKGGRWEYGLEYQYSFDRFSRAGSNYNDMDYLISSRLSVLSVNICYYFLSAQLTRRPEV